MSLKSDVVPPLLTRLCSLQKVQRRFLPLPNRPPVCKGNILSDKVPGLWRTCDPNVGDSELLTANALNDNNSKGAQGDAGRASSYCHVITMLGVHDYYYYYCMLLCFPSCLFNYGMPDCKMQLRYPSVNKSLMFPDLRPESGQFDLYFFYYFYFMTIKLHYLSCNSPLNHTEVPLAPPSEGFYS